MQQLTFQDRNEILAFIKHTTNVKQQCEKVLGISYGTFRRRMIILFGTTSIAKVREREGFPVVRNERNKKLYDFTDQEIYDTLKYMKSMKNDMKRELGINYKQFRRFAIKRYGTAKKYEILKMLHDKCS